MTHFIYLFFPFRFTFGINCSQFWKSESTIINETTSDCVPGSQFIETKAVINECVLDINNIYTKYDCDTDTSVVISAYQNATCLGNPFKVIKYYNGSGCNENDDTFPFYTEINCRNS